MLVLDPPPPGETHLRRRVGEFHGFVRELVASIERQTVDGKRLGSLWDIEGDPAGLRLARLWGYVAESVAAYTELTAGEGYLPTARDWTDLRRIAALVGFKPRPPPLPRPRRPRRSPRRAGSWPNWTRAPIHSSRQPPGSSPRQPRARPRRRSR